MNLSQVEFQFDPRFETELSSLLEEDVSSISWGQRRPENWVFQAIFDASNEVYIYQKLNHFFKQRGLPLPEISSSHLPKKDWVSAVYQSFPPLTIGRFYIHGSHIQDSPPADLIPLRVDAATAFGSGQHESTEGCLKALSLLSKENIFSAPLDMGCGSGILALAMAALWKAPVVACDNDAEAVRVTKGNAKLNGLENLLQAHVSEGFTKLKSKRFDLITANILAGPLCQMAADAVNVLSPGGYVILAGLLNRQAEDVIDAYRSIGAKLVDQLFIGDWSTLIMRKDNHG